MIRNKPKSTLVNLKHGFAPIYFLNIYMGLPCTVLSKGKKKEEYVQMKECRVQREEAAAGTGPLRAQGWNLRCSSLKHSKLFGVKAISFSIFSELFLCLPKIHPKKPQCPSLTSHPAITGWQRGMKQELSHICRHTLKEDFWDSTCSAHAASGRVC